MEGGRVEGSRSCLDAHGTGIGAQRRVAAAGNPSAASASGRGATAP